MSRVPTAETFTTESRVKMLPGVRLGGVDGVADGGVVGPTIGPLSGRVPMPKNSDPATTRTVAPSAAARARGRTGANRPRPGSAINGRSCFVLAAAAWIRSARSGDGLPEARATNAARIWLSVSSWFMTGTPWRA